MRAQECASLALQCKVLHVSSCIAFLTTLGPARAPGQLESSHSASTRRAAWSGECRAYPVVFGPPCPFAFNARAFTFSGLSGCPRLCGARAHYLCAQVGVLASPGPPRSWNLPARPRRDGRRGAVSVVPIPLYLGCPVPLPLTRAHLVVRGCVARARIISARK